MSFPKLSKPTLVFYGAPTFSEQIMLAPVLGILPVLYVEYTHVELATIGLIFMVARLLDAVTDPLIGYLSDITRSRYGARKPWIAAGAAIAVLSVLFYFIPPSSAGAFYFFFWSTLLFLGWTMMTIPYNAWASELTSDYHERTRLFAYRNALGGTGGLLFVASPILLLYWTGSTEYSLELMKILALGLAVLIPLSVGIALYKVPHGTPQSTQPSSVRGLFDSLRRNRVIWLFATITFVGGTSQGLVVSLQFLHVSNYLGLGSYLPFMGIGQMGVYLVSIPIWLHLVKRFGKHRPWAFSSFGLALIAPVILLLEPGPQSIIPIFILSILTGFLSGPMAVSPQSMLTDIIDLDVMRTGVSRAGNYFAFLTLLSKATTAIGAGLGLTLVGLFGYDPKATDHDAMAVLGLLLVLGAVPAVLGTLNGVLILRYPLDARRQKIIRRRIDGRMARVANT